MKPRVAICQPHYIPWIGYFEMLDRVDVFVFLDDVDFIKREWKNRNRIRKEPAASEPKWLSVPIVHADQRGTPIHRARLADGDWRERHLAAFRHVYAQAPFGPEAVDLFDLCLGLPADDLADLNVAGVRTIADYLGLDTETVRSSDLDVSGAKTERLVGLCRALDAGSYLANNGSAAYLEPERFCAEGIDCAYQDYVHPEYTQRWRGAELPFLSHLSVLDLVANHGPDALAILREGRAARA